MKRKRVNRKKAQEAQKDSLAVKILEPQMDTDGCGEVRDEVSTWEAIDGRFGTSRHSGGFPLATFVPSCG